VHFVAHAKHGVHCEFDTLASSVSASFFSQHLKQSLFRILMFRMKPMDSMYLMPRFMLKLPKAF
jgi:hypothetical protein